MANTIDVRGDAAVFKDLIERDLDEFVDDKVSVIYNMGLAYLKSMSFLSLPRVSRVEDTYAINNCHTLADVSLPSATYIGSYAFHNCYALSRFNGPKVSTIGSFAFNQCSALETVNFQVLSSVEQNAFSGCTNLKQVIMPSGRTIGQSAFMGCTGLISVSLATSEEVYLYTDAFAGCTSLRDFTGSVFQFGSSCFQSCEALQSINVTYSTRYGRIPSYCFANCTSLSIANLTSIFDLNSGAFLGCTALQQVILNETGSSTGAIGSSCFKDCASLSLISAPLIRYVEASAFYSCSALTSVEFPNAIRAGNYAFAYCTNLEKVTFSTAFSNTISFGTYYRCYKLSQINNNIFSLTPSVRSSAFYACSVLESMRLDIANRLESECFRACNSLSALYLLSTAVATLVNSNAFLYTPMTTSTYLGYFGSIFVPSSLVSSYKTATNWTYYADRITAYTGE